MANTHRTPEQWQKIVKQHASSGLQIAVFCKQQKLNPSSFYAWRKRLALKNNSFCPTLTNPVEEEQDDWVNIVPDKVAPSTGDVV
jgi:transposase-like protein